MSPLRGERRAHRARLLQDLRARRAGADQAPDRADRVLSITTARWPIAIGSSRPRGFFQYHQLDLRSDQPRLRQRPGPAGPTASRRPGRRRAKILTWGLRQTFYLAPETGPLSYYLVDGLAPQLQRDLELPAVFPGRELQPGRLGGLQPVLQDAVEPADGGDDRAADGQLVPDGQLVQEHQRLAQGRGRRRGRAGARARTGRICRSNTRPSGTGIS